MVRHFLTAILLCAAAAGTAGADERAAPRDAAGTFGHAMISGAVSRMQPILPREGRVALYLDRLGPESGRFSPSQVEALLGGFLEEGSVRAFEVLHLEVDGDASLVQARAKILDRQGRKADIDIHLAFRREDGRWVLREIRELPS